MHPDPAKLALDFVSGNKKNRWLEQTKEPHLGIQALNGVNSGIN